MRFSMISRLSKNRLLCALSLSLLLVSQGYADTNPVREGAFNNMVNNAFPMTPDEIIQFKAIAAKQEEANSQPAGGPSVGTSNIIPVSLKPGAAMPVLRIGQGMITSLVFMDGAGKVWPIASYGIGDPSAFNVNWDKKGGVVMIQGQKLYAQSNMAVMLVGLNVPVMLTLVVGQKQWDYLDYIRVSDNVFNDKGQVQTIPEAPSYLNNLLMGLAPEGSKLLKVEGSSTAQMWSYQGDYLLLTRATLLSPAWKSTMSSGGNDPYNAYVLPKAPLIMLSDQGKVVSVKVSQESAHD